MNRNALNRVVAVINGKGGAGKTSITANVGGMLAHSGYRVLLVDLDPQGNLAEDLGYTESPRNDEGRSLASALAFGTMAEPVADIRSNLDVLIGGYHLDAAAAALSSAKDAVKAKLALATTLEPLASNYDLILVDCPPGTESLQNAAMASARYAVIPARTDKSSRKGIMAVASRLESVLSVNPDLDLLGIAIFGVGTTATRIKEETRSQIIEEVGEDVVFTSTIRSAEAVAKAAREKGKLVYELERDFESGPSWIERLRSGQKLEPSAPKTSGGVAEDYQNLAEEMLQRIAAKEGLTND